MPVNPVHPIAGRSPVHPPAAGPTARLIALPPVRVGLATPPSEVDEQLSRLELARQAQLDALPHAPIGMVATAHRSTVAGILEQVRLARARLRDGLYGVCAGCGTRIGLERLEPRPWLTMCTRCTPVESQQ